MIITNGDLSNYCITKNCQNTEKSPEDLRILGTTRASAKDPQLTQVRKISKEIYHNNIIKHLDKHLV